MLMGIRWAKKDHIFTFFPSIYLFLTLLLPYQINKLMHDAHISIERHRMLSLLCENIFFVSRQYRPIPNFIIHLHLMSYRKKTERGKRNYPNNTFYLSNSGVAGELFKHKFY